MHPISPHQYLASVSKDFSPRLLANPQFLKDLEASLDETDGREKKWCPLRASTMMWQPVAMNLYRNLSIPNAFGRLTNLMRAELPELPRKPVTDEALVHARERLGVDPLQRLFERNAARQVSVPTFHGLHSRAVDGTHLTMPDTEANVTEFGRHKVSKGRTAFPSMRAVVLSDTQSHEVRGVEIGGCYFDEHEGTRRLLKYLQAQDLLLMDRGIPSIELLWEMTQKKLHFLGRISWLWKPKLVKVLGPGDFLVRISGKILDSNQTPGEKRRWIKLELTVRMLEYRVGTTGELIRLMTDLVDPVAYPALELAELYHARWDIELGFDEVKTHLASPPPGTPKTVLRSKTPDGAKQEAYALFLTYNLVRGLIKDAAEALGLPPTQISFVGALEVIHLAFMRMQYAPARLLPFLRRQFLEDLATCKITRPKRKRRYARVVKINKTKFPTKKTKDRGEYFDAAQLLAAGNLVPALRKAA